MGEEINVEKIECVREFYQIDIRYEESCKSSRVFVRKDALLAMLAIAEKEAVDEGYYQI